MHMEETALGLRLCFDAEELGFGLNFEDALHDDHGCATILRSFARLVSKSARARVDAWEEMRQKAQEEGLIEEGDELEFSFPHRNFRVIPHARKPAALETALEEAKRAAVEAQDFTAGAAIRDVLDRVRKEARERQRAVSAPIEGSEPEVEALAARIDKAVVEARSEDEVARQKRVAVLTVAFLRESLKEWPEHARPRTPVQEKPWMHIWGLNPLNAGHSSECQAASKSAFALIDAARASDRTWKSVVREKLAAMEAAAAPDATPGVNEVKAVEAPDEGAKA